MITLRKRLGSNRTRKSLLPALLFLAAATFTATGSGAIAALCLVPAGLVLDSNRDDSPSKKQA